ncbi:hypothetical protein O7606_22895 [Micromonospora sp. WMMD882]|uniref:hypothetical protein n=1 Tax=Micromonospora sp. WMMD882 TaxID=3015151 RepID=UPI00248CB629|nr:hypothetical protein [Micromonospora sp. WMMD882]WBB79007.1 hypothetical protein O7606_22895 [Micromonospora sp. WMMD882]
MAVPHRPHLLDPTLREWECTVLYADPEQGIVLDRSAFYPLDVQADGGTHVASTARIGRIQVVKVESKGRANRRVRVRLTD